MHLFHIRGSCCGIALCLLGSMQAASNLKHVFQCLCKTVALPASWHQQLLHPGEQHNSQHQTTLGSQSNTQHAPARLPDSPSPYEQLQQAGGKAALRGSAAAHHWPQLLGVPAQQRLALGPQQG
jgi:hypothetical protein